jgi:hypothetical protein
MRELPSHGAGSENRNKSIKVSSKGKERLFCTEKLISDLQWRGLVCESCLPMGLGVRTEIKVSSKRKERLVSTERLILTFSGEVWYAGVTVPWGWE